MPRVGNTTTLRWAVINDVQAYVAATVTATVTGPDGVLAYLTIESDDIGRFRGEFVPSQAGRHVVQWAASGAWSASLTDVLNVDPSVDTAAIISLAEAREHLNIPDEETIEDAELLTVIAAASVAVERHLGIVVARRTITELVTAVQGQPLRLRSPLVAVTSATDAAGDEVDVTDWVVDGHTGFVTGAPAGDMTVNYRAGLLLTPQTYITATQIVCGHMWATQRANTFTPRYGGDTTTVVGMGYALPNRAIELLGGRAPNMP